MTPKQKTFAWTWAKLIPNPRSHRGMSLAVRRHPEYWNMEPWETIVPQYYYHPPHPHPHPKDLQHWANMSFPWCPKSSQPFSDEF